MLPVYEPLFTEEDAIAAYNVVKSGVLSAFGPEVTKLEQQFAKYIGTKYALSCSSGTTGLYLALKPIIKSGDYVAVPNGSYAATAFAAIHHNAKVLYIDSDIDTWNLDLNALERACQSYPVKVVIAVHTYGNPIDMGKLLDLSNKYGFYVIEDACEALSAIYDEKMVGSIGHIGVFSFYGNKTLSVTGSTPLYIRHNGIIKIINATELNNISSNNLECASFSPIDGTIEWAPVSHIISHNYTGNIIRITTDYNKHIDVTTNHNLFVLRNGSIVDLPTSDLRRGDYVVCPRKLPGNDTDQTIDILDYLDNKCIPEFIFNSSFDHKLQFIREYWRDGCIRNTSPNKSKSKTHVEFKTVSKQLATKLQYLLLSIGCVSAIEYDKSKPVDYILGRKVKKRRAYKVRISDNKFIALIADTYLQPNRRGQLCDMVPVDQFNIKSCRKYINQFKLNNVSFLGKDLCFLRIKKIRKIKSGTNRVYDLSVPSRFENFVGGYGGLCLHNSSGEGGIITTNNNLFYEQMKLERGQGQDPNRRFHHLVPGWNFRLTNLQAAIINSQFMRLPSIIKRKQEIAKRYLNQLDGLMWQSTPLKGEHCWWMVTVRHYKDGWYEKASKHLADNEIETRPLFPPISLMPASGCQFIKSDCPNAIRLHDTCITLPSGLAISNDQIDHVCSIINKLY